MPHSDQAVQVGGAWLAMASFLMIAVLGLHGPIPPDLHDRMAMVAGAGQLEAEITASTGADTCRTDSL